jgi:hypothetical protein
MIPGVLALLVVGVLAYGLLNAPPASGPPGQADLPTIGSLTQGRLPATGPTPAPTSTPTATPAPTPSPSATATPSPSVSSSP